MSTLLFIGGLLVGYYVWAVGGTQIMISLFCGIPITQKLEIMFSRAADYATIKSAMTKTIILWGVIIAAIVVGLIAWGNSSFIWGTAIGAIVAFALSIGRIGITPQNLADYIRVYSRCFYNPEEFTETILRVFMRGE